MASFVTRDDGVREVFNATRYRLIVPKANITECGYCGRSWDDSWPTAMTPAPSGRCPFEYDHEYDD